MLEVIRHSHMVEYQTRQLLALENLAPRRRVRASGRELHHVLLQHGHRPGTARWNRRAITPEQASRFF